MVKNRTNLLTFILSLSASAVGILLNFSLARILESETYGNIQYLVSLSSTISSFLVFGFSGYIIKEAANKEHKINVVNKCFTLFFFICFITTPVMFYLLNHLFIDDSSKFFSSFIVLLVSVVMGIITIGSSYFQGIGQYRKSIVIESLLPKVFMLLLTFLFFFFGKITLFEKHYLLFYLLFYGISSVVILKIQFKKIDFTAEKGDIITWLSFFGATVTFTITTNLTKVFQKSLFNNSVALAITAVSLSIISLLSIFNTVIQNTVKPIFAKQMREGKQKELVDTFRLVTRSTSYICIPFYIFLLTQGSKFLSFFGDSYLVYPLIIVILAIRGLFSDLTGPTGTMLVMIGKEKFELFNGIINLSTFLISVVLLRKDPIYGMCWSLLISTVSVNLARFIEVWIVFKKPPLNFKTILSMMISAIINFTLIFFLKLIQPFWLWFSISLLVGFICIVINFAISLYNKDAKQILKIRL